MRWKRSAATSKQDHRVVLGRVLRRRAMLGVQAGAGNSDEGRGGRRWLGKSWRVRRRAAGEGNRAGVGRGRRVGFIPAGGGVAAAAERRPGAMHSAGSRGAVQSTCPRKKKRGEVSGGLIWKSQKFQGLLGKARFPTDLEV
jgi:hypothetical protein